MSRRAGCTLCKMLMLNRRVCCVWCTPAGHRVHAPRRPALAPKASMGRQSLILQRGPDYVNWPLRAREHLAAGQVEPVGARADQRVETWRAHTIDEPPDVAPVDRSGAHGARL